MHLVIAKIYKNIGTMQYIVLKCIINFIIYIYTDRWPSNIFVFFLI